MARPVKKGTLPAECFTIEEFCEVHRIGRSMYYILQKEGRGPRVIKIGTRKVITKEDAARWREEQARSEGGPRERANVSAKHDREAERKLRDIYAPSPDTIRRWRKETENER